jgi:hypothetical protein
MAEKEGAKAILPIPSYWPTSRNLKRHRKEFNGFTILRDVSNGGSDAGIGPSGSCSE